MDRTPDSRVEKDPFNQAALSPTSLYYTTSHQFIYVYDLKLISHLKEWVPGYEHERKEIKRRNKFRSEGKRRKEFRSYMSKEGNEFKGIGLKEGK